MRKMLDLGEMELMDVFGAKDGTLKQFKAFKAGKVWHHKHFGGREHGEC